MSFWRKAAPPPTVDECAAALLYAEAAVQDAAKDGSKYINLDSIEGWQRLRVLLSEAYRAGARSKDDR